MTAANFRRLDADYPSFMAALEWSWATGDHDDAVRLAVVMWLYWYWSGHHEACDMERAAGVPVSSPAMVAPAVMARVGCAYLLRNFGRDSGGRTDSLMAEAIEVADAGDDALSRAGPGSSPPTSPWSPGASTTPGNFWARRADCVADRRFGGRCDLRPVSAWSASAGDLEGAQESVRRPLEFLASAADTPQSRTRCASPPWCEPAGNHSATRLGEEAVAAARRFPAPQLLVMALARAAEAAVLLGNPPDARPHRGRTGRHPPPARGALLGRRSVRTRRHRVRG